MNNSLSSVTIGNGCTFIIDNNKDIYSFGYNKNGKIGHNGNDEIISVPLQIKSLENIKMIGCGITHAICCNFEGIVYGFGKNDYGQLTTKPNDNLSEFHIPFKIDITPIDSLCCGYYFSICLSFDNNVYSFGRNDKGQLGLGHNKNANSPQLIAGLKRINSIGCGNNFVVCCSYNSDIYSWGYNYYGQLGLGNTEDSNIPIKHSKWYTNDITCIKCGTFNTLFLTSNGDLYSCGLNDYGVLGIDNKRKKQKKPKKIKNIPEIQRIECGFRHSLCLDINDNLWTFGWNGHGQLGFEDKEDRYKPFKVESIGKVIDISNGGHHSIIKTNKDKIYTFGYNEFSQLGFTSDEKDILKITQLFKNNEIIWSSTHGRSKQKSARK